MDQNPALIQNAAPSKQGAAPLILIHDGGGTTFSYHCLQPLNRTVYAIHNPRFYSGRVWAGGIPAMAKVYVEFIRSVVPSGPLIVGGWSLGGLISLEIASLLTQTADLDLLGLVMIDSICPNALKHHPQNIVTHIPLTSSRCKPEINFLISTQLKASAKMVENWTMPSWSSRPYPSFAGRNWTGNTALDHFKGAFSTAASVSPHGSVSPFPSSPVCSRGSSTTALIIYSGEDIDNNNSSPELLIENNEAEEESDVHADSPPPPPTILLRCGEYVPVSKSKNPDAVSKVDVARDCRLLGWDEYNPNLVQCVLDIPGNHFNLFAEDNISMTGKQIREACDMLERMDMRDGFKACLVDYL